MIFTNRLSIRIQLFGLCLLTLAAAQGQSANDPLEAFDFYMGIWVPPSDHPMIDGNPKMAHLQVIDFKWGDRKKLIHSSTGIISEQDNIPFSEGIISFNPHTEKIVWLEYQYDNNLLFEGEYIVLEKGALQRLYIVHYAEGYKSIPNPKEAGWTRLYRETFTPISADTIDWKTETYIGNKWIKAGSPSGFKAVRKQF